MKRDTEYGLRETGDWDRRSLGVGVFPSPLRLRASALKPLTTHHSPLTTPARAAFTLMELLVVMSIMLIVSTILVAGYFGMTRAASYTAAETDVFNHLQLARQRASLDGTRVFFLLIDSNSYVLVHGAGQLTRDMDSKIYDGRHRIYDAYADMHEITNKASHVRVWNMDKNLYGDDVNINPAAVDGPAPTFPGSEENYFRHTCVLDARLPNAAQWNRWKQGDRYGFELYPRQVLPKGFYFGLQDLDNAPRNESIVFAADGTSSRVSGSPPVITRTGITSLFIYERIAKDTKRAIQIQVKNPDGSIKVVPL